jgi:hypothetical protein
MSAVLIALCTLQAQAAQAQGDLDRAYRILARRNSST